ncbi:MAG: hypothetical protein AB8H86_03495 [Polyangiales bacterium]
MKWNLVSLGVLFVLLLTPKYDTPAWLSTLSLALPLGIASLLGFVFRKELSALKRRVRHLTTQQKRLEQVPTEDSRGAFGVVSLDDGEEFAARVEIELERPRSRSSLVRTEKGRERYARPFTLVHPSGERIRVNPDALAPSKIDAPPGPLVEASGRLFRVAEIVEGDVVTVLGALTQEHTRGPGYRGGNSVEWVLRPRATALSFYQDPQGAIEARSARATRAALAASFLPGLLAAIAVVSVAFMDMMAGLPHRVLLSAFAATVVAFTSAVPVRLALNMRLRFVDYPIAAAATKSLTRLRTLSLAQAEQVSAATPRARAIQEGPEEDAVESQGDAVHLEHS